MKKCTSCERPLVADEEDICPACKSEKDRKKKLWAELGMVAIAIIGAIANALLSGNSGGDGGNSA